MHRGRLLWSWDPPAEQEKQVGVGLMHPRQEQDVGFSEPQEWLVQRLGSSPSPLLGC